MQISAEDFQRYLRIVLQWVSAALVSYGIATPNATWVPIAMGVASSALTLAWTIYGNRIQAKINEVAKLGSDPTSPVKGVLIEQSTEGRALATSIMNSSPDAAVALAGTHSATQMASNPMTMQATPKTGASQ